MHPPPVRLPLLTRAGSALTREIEVLDEYGDRRVIHIPDERPLTLYVDRRELVTLMTLGAEPELLALGYLRNQRLVTQRRRGAVDHRRLGCRRGGGAHARRHRGLRAQDGVARGHHRLRPGHRVRRHDGRPAVGAAARRASARISQSMLRDILEVMRQQDSIHRKAGSVHGCALFRGTEKLMFIEDVGRHNAIDTIAGWMWMNGVQGADKVFYTTGRLTSEMVMKSAQIGVPIIVSRNGVTAMGHEMATRLGMTLFGRASNRHFICYTGFERFDSEPRATTRPDARACPARLRRRGR